MSARVDASDVDRFAQRLRRASPELGVKVRSANNKVARGVVDHAQSKASGVGRQAARAAASLRASNQVARAQVVGGSARLVWFKGAEFGSKRFKQFKPWRGNQSASPFEGGAGYFLYPSIREDKDKILGEYREAIMDAAGIAFH